eukprot:8759213-Heterocapsa_arctica.AAC.1
MAIWRGTGLTFVTVVQLNGRGDRHVMLALERWFCESGLNDHVYICTDSDVRIRAIAVDVAVSRASANMIPELISSKMQEENILRREFRL